jgi:hypothetical protein
MTEQHLIVRNSQNINVIRCLDTRELSPKCQMLEVAFEHTERVWKRWLSRRSSKHRLNWEQWMVRWQAICPLPKPRIVHAF